MRQSPVGESREGSQGSEKQVVRHRKEDASNAQDTDTDIVSSLVPQCSMLGIFMSVWMRGWTAQHP